MKTLIHALLVVSSLSFTGCQIRTFTTTGNHPKPASEEGTHESSPTSTSTSTPGTPATVSTSSPKKHSPLFDRAVRDYDAAMTAIPQIKEAADVVPIRKQLAGCLSDLSGLDASKASEILDTASGPMTAEKLKASCRAKFDELGEKKFAGCFARDVEMKSFSTGGGSWTPIEMSTPFAKYSPFKCADMPKAQKTPSAFNGLVPKIMKECGGAPSVVEFISSGWEHKPLLNGGVQRTAAADCWFKGEVAGKDW